MLESRADIAVMDSGAEPLPSASALAELPAPRRVAIAGLFREALGTERELAELYAGAARRTPIAHLRTALEGLAALKRERVAALAALAPVLDPDADGTAGLPPHGVLDAGPERRADVFARAFTAERTLEAAYREIAALLGDPARCPGLDGLIAESAHHRRRLRDLYLRYS